MKKFKFPEEDHLNIQSFLEKQEKKHDFDTCQAAIKEGKVFFFSALLTCLYPKIWVKHADLPFRDSKKPQAFEEFQKKHRLFGLLRLEERDKKGSEGFRARLTTALQENGWLEYIKTIKMAEADVLLASCLTSDELLEVAKIEHYAEVIASGKFCLAKILRSDRPLLALYLNDKKDINETVLIPGIGAIFKKLSEYLTANKKGSEDYDDIVRGFCTYYLSDVLSNFTQPAHSLLYSEFMRLLTTFPGLVRVLIQSVDQNKKLCGVESNLLLEFTAKASLVDVNKFVREFESVLVNSPDAVMRLVGNEAFYKLVNSSALLKKALEEKFVSVERDRKVKILLLLVQDTDHAREMFFLFARQVKAEFADNDYTNFVLKIAAIKQCEDEIYALVSDVLASHLTAESLNKLSLVGEESSVVHLAMNIFSREVDFEVMEALAKSCDSASSKVICSVQAAVQTVTANERLLDGCKSHVLFLFLNKSAQNIFFSQAGVPLPARNYINLINVADERPLIKFFDDIEKVKGQMPVDEILKLVLAYVTNPLFYSVLCAEPHVKYIGQIFGNDLSAVDSAHKSSFLFMVNNDDVLRERVLSRIEFKAWAAEIKPLIGKRASAVVVAKEAVTTVETDKPDNTVFKAPISSAPTTGRVVVTIETVKVEQTAGDAPTPPPRDSTTPSEESAPPPPPPPSPPPPPGAAPSAPLGSAPVKSWKAAGASSTSTVPAKPQVEDKKKGEDVAEGVALPAMDVGTLGRVSLKSRAGGMTALLEKEKAAKPARVEPEPPTGGLGKALYESAMLINRTRTRMDLLSPKKGDGKVVEKDEFEESPYKGKVRRRSSFSGIIVASAKKEETEKTEAKAAQPKVAKVASAPAPAPAPTGAASLTVFPKLRKTTRKPPQISSEVVEAAQIDNDQLSFEERKKLFQSMTKK